MAKKWELTALDGAHPRLSGHGRCRHMRSPGSMGQSSAEKENRRGHLVSSGCRRSRLGLSRGGYVAALSRILYESGRRRPGGPTGFGTQSVLSGGQTPQRGVFALASRPAHGRPLS